MFGADLYLHAWDERYHALVAKNFLKHPLLPTLYDNPLLPFNYKGWDMNHVWLHKQPLPMWLMALSMKSFGVNEIALRLPSILLSSLSIYFTYYIGAYLFNKQTGLLAAFFHSINGLVIEITGGRVATDHYDILFLVFIELAILLSIAYVKTNKRFLHLLIGASVGAAILTKWLPALIVIPIWYLLVCRKDDQKNILINFALLSFACIAFFLPWQIYIMNTFPLEAQWEYNYNLLHILEPLQGHSGSFFYHFNKIRIIFGELIYIPILWFLYVIYRRRANLNIIIIGIWFLVPYIFFSAIQTKMQGYILFAAPSIFILLAYFWWKQFKIRRKTKYPKLLILFLILLIVLPIRYSFERVKPFHKLNRNPKWAVTLKNLDEKIIPNNAVLFNIDYSIEAMFYSEIVAYPYLPTADQVMYLNNKGYNIYVYDTGDLPQYILDNKSIIIPEIQFK